MCVDMPLHFCAHAFFMTPKIEKNGHFGLIRDLDSSDDVIMCFIELLDPQNLCFDTKIMSLC